MKKHFITAVISLSIFLLGYVIFSAQSLKLVVQTGHNTSSVISSVSVSPNGRYLVSGGEDGIIKVWDVESGKELHSLKLNCGVDEAFSCVEEVIFSTDGKNSCCGRRCSRGRIHSRFGSI